MEKNDIAEDELFGHFVGALEKVHYFGATPNGDDELAVDRATHLLHNAFLEMKKSRCEEIDLINLADAFKLQGNKAMQSKVYVDAIELYTIAIALCDNNAVYYCNRAAAYTQNNQHTEAIHDCNKAIEINPNYSKAYSRLGFS
ncbi:small glutamine-rich tetratricopeptide repeat-containing protein 2-like [Bidens hawaiensis]|uniref:small glutamine-rich tetratricopeptide repeat-containing protein 2-like n=1 Tax=Bidens hawaiensis TaxID=980011 RepID=UPI00404B2A43